MTTRTINSIHNRVAAFECLAEQSKTKSGVMQIAPKQSTTDFASVKVAGGRETFGASVKFNPSVKDTNNNTEISGGDNIPSSTKFVEEYITNMNETKNPIEIMSNVQIKPQQQQQQQQQQYDIEAENENNRVEEKIAIDERNDCNTQNNLKPQFVPDTSRGEVIDTREENEVAMVQENKNSLADKRNDSNIQSNVDHQFAPDTDTCMKKIMDTGNKLTMVEGKDENKFSNIDNTHQKNFTFNEFEKVDDENLNNKSMKEILEEEDKKIGLEEVGPVSEINVSTSSKSSKDTDEDDSRSKHSISPLSFTDQAVAQKKQNPVMQNSAITAIDEDEDFFNSMNNMTSKDDDPWQFLSEKSDFVIDTLMEKPEMNSGNENKDDFPLGLEMEDQMLTGTEESKAQFKPDVEVIQDDVLDRDVTSNVDTKTELQQTSNDGSDDSSLVDYFENLLTEPCVDNGDGGDKEEKLSLEQPDSNLQGSAFKSIENEIDNPCTLHKSPSAELLGSKFHNLVSGHEALKQPKSDVHPDVMNIPDTDYMNPKVELSEIKVNPNPISGSSNTDDTSRMSVFDAFLSMPNMDTADSNMNKTYNVQGQVESDDVAVHDIFVDDDTNNFQSSHVKNLAKNDHSELSFMSPKNPGPMDQNQGLHPIINNTTPYNMYSAQKFEDELKPTATVLFENNDNDDMNGTTEDDMKLPSSMNIEESDDISDTSPFAEMLDDDDDFLEEAHFVNNSNGINHVQKSIVSPITDDHFSYFPTSISNSNNELNMDTQGHVQTNPALDVNNGMVSSTFIHGKQDNSQNPAIQINESESKFDSNELSNDNAHEQEGYIKAKQVHASSSGPPLTYRNTQMYGFNDDTDSLGISIMTEDQQDEESLMYSVAEKSHATTSTSISQGGQIPKKRPTSGSDPSQPLPIFRTASTLRDNPNLHNAHSTISELTGMENASIVSSGKRLSIPPKTSAVKLGTISGASPDRKPASARGRSPFGRRRSEKSAKSSKGGNSSPFRRPQGGKSAESTKGGNNHHSVTNSYNVGQKQKTKKKRGFSLRSLSPWRWNSSRKRETSPEFPRQESLGSTNSRPTIKRTPSQIIADDELAEAAVPLVAISPSQDSEEKQKTTGRFSLRSLSPFRRRSSRPQSKPRSNSKQRSHKKNAKHDPFYEDNSLSSI